MSDIHVYLWRPSLTSKLSSWARSCQDISFVKMSLTKEQRNKLRVLIGLETLSKLELLEVEEVRALRKSPRFWVNPVLLKREKYDIEAHLLKDLLWEDGQDYKNFCRMTISSFEGILGLVEEKIKKEDTIFRYAITARVRLATTLRFIATGDSYRSLEYLTRISRKTISKFVPEVLNAIYSVLQPKYLKMPATHNDWLQIANDFNYIWDFPHTLGAIDGKHIRIKAPPHSGSDFYNYKGFFSVVLLAVVNAHSKFVYIDVGSNGRASDNVVLKNSKLYSALLCNELFIPPAENLGRQGIKVPYFFIGDDIFGLDKHIMKAYNRNLDLDTKQEIFNYRLSRARMTVEMAFGRLVSRFRIFSRSMEVLLETVDIVVKTCCVLHNYLSQDITSAPDVDETSRSNFPETVIPLNVQEHNRYRHSSVIRDVLSQYCVTEGNVDYQWKKLGSSKNK